MTLSSLLQVNYIISYIIAIACRSHSQIRNKPDKTALVNVTILDWDASYRTKQHNICVPPNQSLSELLQCEHLLTRIEVTESNCFLLKCFSMNFWINWLWNVENVKAFVPYDTEFSSIIWFVNTQYKWIVHCRVLEKLFLESFCPHNSLLLLKAQYYFNFMHLVSENTKA